MIIELPGGRRLVLAGGELGWFWALTGVVAIALLVWLYRTERALISRRAGLVLLALRLAVAAVLVGALFEPIAARTIRRTVRGRVVLAVDTSESMSTTDPGRNGEERAALTKALGLSPAEPIDRLSRREVARRLIDGPRAPLASLASDHDLEALAFARDTTPATPTTLAEALAVPPPSGDRNAQSTDWLPVLEQALKSASDGSPAPVLGVVLVTDGRRNVESSTTSLVDRLAARGVPIFPVLVGSTRPPTDAAVASVKAPASVYKGDLAPVEAVLKLDGYAGRDVSVVLERPGAEPLRQTVRAPSDGSRPTVTFRVPLEIPGIVPLTVAVEHLPDDSRADNDRRTVGVQVSDDKARVLLVDGEARWEFRYVRNALARDPRIALESVVFDQPKAGLAPAVGEPAFTYGTEFPARGNTTEADPLGAFDVIVLGDLDPADLPADAWKRLDAYVAERGGTVVFSPGSRWWSELASNEVARKLLPVTSPGPVPIDPGMADPAHPGLPPGAAFEPTAEALGNASAWPMLQLAAETEESRRRWSGLPRLPWALAGQVKPGATTLATVGGNPSAALLAAQAYGLGKTMLVGTDGTWRWRHRVGDAYHHRFWGQIVRWAAAGKLGAGNAFVRFGPLEARVDEGKPVRIQARLTESVSDAAAGPGLLLAAQVLAPASAPGAAPGVIAVVPLRPVPGQPRTFEGSTPGLPAGTYLVRLDAPGAAAALGLEGPTPPAASLEVTPRDGSERVELAATRDPLDALAAATSGRVLLDGQAADLPPLLRARTLTAERVEEVRLWDQPASLVLIFTLLTVEWVVRKRVGLP